jgi:mono/diheme cytochrome c family protein
MEATRVTCCLLVCKSRRLVFAALPALVVLVLFSGCVDNSYPDEMTYPGRTDLMANPQQKPDHDVIENKFDPPGEYPETIFAYLTAEERNKVVVDPMKAPADQRQQIERLLEGIFGTPAHPTVEGSAEMPADLRETLTTLQGELKLDRAALALGSQVYRQQCLHCHGLSGDGHGATAPWVNPHPRDYRQGIFKFTSSSQAEGVRKPRRDDLLRTVREGINGSSMPSFRMLTEDDLEHVVSYVIHLSLRGEVEFQVLVLAARGEIDPDDGIAGTARAYLERAVKNWQKAQTSMIQPGPFTPYKNDQEHQAAVQRGWKLFAQQGPAEGQAAGASSTGCGSCHADYGRQAPYKYDYWGTITRPMDVTQGIYRGGSRPIDLYWRIHSGINGTGMTAFGASLTSDQVWDLVAFLQVLPYPQMRQKYGVKLESE